MNTTPNNYFFVSKTIETQTGKMHHIKWRWEMEKAFLKELTQNIITLGWMKSGLYSIKHEGNRTIISIDDRILKQFFEVFDYLAKRYGD